MEMSTLTPELQKESIITQLKQLAADRNIEILFAGLVGSRVWGFAGPDSDYDVRFIYLQDKDKYLQLDPPNETIEFKGLDNVEFAGWDIRKALGLARKSNPMLLEILSSSEIYIETPTFAWLKQAAEACFSSEATFYHHAGLLHTTMKRFIDEKPTFPLKKYLHAVRSALAMELTSRSPYIPPLSIQEMSLELNGIAFVNENFGELLSHIGLLIRRREVADGDQTIAGTEVIDAFLTKHRESLKTGKTHIFKDTRPGKEPLGFEEKTKMLNDLFLKALWNTELS